MIENILVIGCEAIVSIGLYCKSFYTINDADCAVSHSFIYKL